MKRSSFFLIAFGLATVGTIWLVNRGNTESPASQTPAPAVADSISANGLVEGATPEVALRPEIVGTIRLLAFRENQQVKKGEVLFELENDLQKRQVAVAKAEWDQAEAELDRVRHGERTEKRQSLAALAAAKKAAFEQARKNAERAKNLIKSATVSNEEHDNAIHQMERAREEWRAAEADHAFVEAPARQDELDAAKAKAQAAKARWQVTEAELARTQVRAPSDGCVLQVFAEPGDQAGPATSRPVLLFADLSKIRVRAFVEELAAPRVTSGQKAVVTVDGLPGQSFHGKVTLVLPRMGKRAPNSDNPGEYTDLYYREVLVDLERGDGLVIGLRTTVRIAY
jgi:multidrug resistance efflux pump